MRWSALAALLLLLSPQTTRAQAVVTNVGVDASRGFVLENNYVAFLASENNTGVDLNGDGDLFDSVLHIYDSQTGSLLNTALEASGQLYVSGHYVAWTVYELNQGGVSLNGDTDAVDFVLHLADMATGTVTNFGLAASDPVIEGNTLGALVIENKQGMTDLNGDGDSGDGVLHLIDIPSGAVTNVGVDASARFVLDGNRAVFGTREASEGNADLNMDGDTSDTVLHAWDGSTVTNLMHSSDLFEFQLEGDIVAFLVRESSEGNADLNGDSDALDKVLHVHDFTSGTTTNLGVALQGGTDFRLNGGLVAMAVSESFQATDLNGDLDAFDSVLHLHDTSSSPASVTNLGYAIQGFQLNNGRLAFGVSESEHDATDLNGDGDAADLVLHLYDVAGDTTQNLATDASFGFKLDDEMLLGFGSTEASQGGADGNGDGDAADFNLYVFDISTGVLRNLAVDPSGGLQTFQVDGKFVSFGVNEFAQGSVDFNNDGDFGDVVLHFFDATSGVSTNLELDVSSGHQLQAGTIAFVVSENKQNAADLNGDGDAGDLVLHVAKLDLQPLSASDMIEALIAHVKSLDLHRRVERRHVALLRLAQRALDKDKPCLSMKLLKLFQWSVHKTPRRWIPAADASELIEEAGDIIDVLEAEYPDCARHDHRRHKKHHHKKHHHNRHCRHHR